MPYGHFAVNYVKPLIIGKRIDTAQRFGTSIGLSITNNGFAQYTFEYNKKMYKFEILCFVSILKFCGCLQFCVALQAFSVGVMNN